jgi:hypothetical protein
MKHCPGKNHPERRPAIVREVGLMSALSLLRRPRLAVGLRELYLGSAGSGRAGVGAGVSRFWCGVSFFVADPGEVWGDAT